MNTFVTKVKVMSESCNQKTPKHEDYVLSIACAQRHTVDHIRDSIPCYKQPTRAINLAPIPDITSIESGCHWRCLEGADIEELCRQVLNDLGQYPQPYGRAFPLL